MKILQVISLMSDGSRSRQVDSGYNRQYRRFGGGKRYGVRGFSGSVRGACCDHVYHIDIVDDESRMIMRNVVSNSSLYHFTNENIRSIMWIYGDIYAMY